jgi:hypothetical protein
MGSPHPVVQQFPGGAVDVVDAAAQQDRLSVVK